MRRFEEQYRLNEGDDVLNRENAIHQDVDLRLDAIELLGQAFAEGNRADIEALIAAYRDTVSGLAKQVEDLLGEAEGGISANAIAETTDRLFFTAARRAAILAELRDGVDASGDTMAKLLALIVGVVGGAPAGRQSLKAINDAVVSNTAALNAILTGADPLIDTFAEIAAKFTSQGSALTEVMAAIGNRLRGDAAGSYTDAQIAQFLANLGLGPLTFGQCRLNYVSATQLKLLPYGGNLLWINGAYRRIPAAGIAFANTGLAPSTAYYLYAYWTGTAVALEASTTSRATDTTWGHQIKSGDATRTLVGGFFTDGSSPGQFRNSAQARCTASWFHRRSQSLYTPMNNTAATASSTPIPGNADTIAFVWGDEIVSYTASGYVTNNANNNWAGIVILGNGNTITEVSLNTVGGAVSNHWADLVPEGLMRFNIGVVNNGSGGASFRVFGTAIVRQ